jgi:hypothetical protein
MLPSESWQVLQILHLERAQVHRMGSCKCYSSLLSALEMLSAYAKHGRSIPSTLSFQTSVYCEATAK